MVPLTDPADTLRGFRIASAAERLGTSPAALRASIRRGYVHATRVGRVYLIPLTEMQRLLTPSGTAGTHDTGA